VPSYAAKVGPRAVSVVIIVIALSHHQEIEGKEIPGSVFHFEIAVAVLVGKPVDDRAVDGAKCKLNGQQ